MDIPEIDSYKDIAADTVAHVVNKALDKLGARQNLYQIAQSRAACATKAFLSLGSLKPPLAYSSEKFIANAIEKVWHLTDTFDYHLEYRGGSQDEVSQYYYFEAVFCQLTARYPIAQATCSVFFRVQDKHFDPPECKVLPEMTFRIEGHHTDHDVRYVKLIRDWILAVLQKKIKFFMRVEALKFF